MDLFAIINDKQEIRQTSFYDSPMAKEGFVYLSWNAGAGRLLVPDSNLSFVDEMKTGKYVVVSKGVFRGLDALELMFEDGSDCPFSVHIAVDQTDRVLPETDEGGGFVISVWTRSGKQSTLPGKYRVVDKLPDLSAWVEH